MSLLSLKKVTKRFGGLTAVNAVSFDVDAGTVMGLIGPNGAGKTTCFNLITGNYTPEEGTILFDGKPVIGLAPHKIVEMGIARTFQTIRLFQNMSVVENVLAGCHCRMKSGVLSAMFGLASQKKEEAEALVRAEEELAFVGLAEQANNQAKNLSYGKQRLLEIARALATDPRILILDEPAGGMNDQETSELIDLIGVISKERGITVLLIEHDMSLVMNACEKLVVVEFGAKIAEGFPEEIKNDPRVIEAYLGTDEDLH